MLGASMKNVWSFQVCISVLFFTETKLLWILVEQCVGVVESAYHFHGILWQCAVWWQTSAKCNSRTIPKSGEKLHSACAATVPLCEMLSHLWLYKEAFGYSQTCSDHDATTKADWLWKRISHCMAPRPLFQARSGQTISGLPLSHMETESTLPRHREVQERCRSGHPKKTTHCENRFIQR